MRKLEEIAQAEEKKLELAEQYLEEDAQMFDEFLKENDKNSVDAIKMYVTHNSKKSSCTLQFHDFPGLFVFVKLYM
jgi:exonuclease I